MPATSSSACSNAAGFWKHLPALVTRFTQWGAADTCGANIYAKVKVMLTVETLVHCCSLRCAAPAAGMENMKTQFEERARVLLERMTVLGTKQEEMLEAQGHLGNELALVGGKVSAVSEQVGFSNHAILMLCGALSEMAKRVGISNGRYVKELENLSRSVHSLPAGHMGGMAALGGGMAAAGGNLVSSACYRISRPGHLQSVTCPSPHSVMLISWTSPPSLQQRHQHLRAPGYGA